MIRWIVGSSIRSRRIVIAFAVVLMGVGFVRLRAMPRDLLPEFTPPTVEVQTESLGLSAAEVEQLITTPLEQDLLNGVAFLQTIRSESIAGLSSIEMIFEPGTDLLDARQVVAERLTQAHALPNVSKPPQMLQPLSSSSRVMFVALSSEEVDATTLSLRARYTINPRLLGVPGVANVSIWGQRERQLQVLVDPQRLSENGVTLQQVIETTANSQFVSSLSFVEASTPGTGGIIETPSQRIGVIHAVPFETAEDLAGVIIEGTEDAPLRLGDVADVVIDHQVLIGDALLPDGAGLLLVLEKFPGADSVQVTRDVEAAMESLAPGLEGVSVDTSLFRPASFIESSKDNLGFALAVAAALVLLALGALLFNWRTAIVSIVAIAASMLVAALVLSLLDVTLNAMIAAGLVLGLLVVIDEAVGDAEIVARRLWQRRSNGEAPPVARVVRDAAIERRGSALYAGLIAVIAFVPAFFTGGPFGAFFPSIAVAYAVAVLASMVIALTLTPALSALVMSRAPVTRHESPVVSWVRPRYERALDRSLASVVPALVLVGVLLIGGAAAVPFLDRSLTPEFRDTDLLVNLDGASGTSLTEMNRVAARVAGELEGIPGVASVGGNAGRAIQSDRVSNVNRSQLWVNIDPGADYSETVASIRDVVEGYPGLDREVASYPSARVAEVLATPENPVTVRLYGTDLEILKVEAERIRDVLAGTDGIVDPKVQLPAEEPTLQIEVDLEKAAAIGIVPGDVRRAAAAMLSGIEVGSLFEEQKVFQVVVWGAPDTRSDLSSIDDLLIDTDAGTQVRLGDVADVRLVASPSVIRHEAVSRSLDITANVSGRDLGAVTDDIENELRTLVFPIEYHAELVNDYADARTADRQVLGFIVAAAIAIFLLLQAGIGSWRMAAIVFALLPVSLAGGAVAALIGGGTVSLGSVAGFVALMGATARHAVLQVRHLRALEHRDRMPFGPDLVARGARETFPSILMWICVTALALLPFVVAGGIAGLETVHPMAVVMLGGLVSSGAVVSFLIPRASMRFGTGSEPDLSVLLAEPVIDLTGKEDAELTSS